MTQNKKASREGIAAGPCLGYAVGPVLPFVSAGVAVGRVSGELDGECPGDDWCGSDTKTGWTAGGGLEWAFNDKWSAKAEYLFVDLGSAHFGEGTAEASWPTLRSIPRGWV